MPIYEYQCEDCHEIFEVRQKMSDAPPSGHQCGSKSVKRVLSNTSFVLKGTGWYKTDYADKQNRSGSSDGHSSGQENKKAENSQKASNPSEAATGKQGSAQQSDRSPTPPKTTPPTSSPSGGKKGTAAA